MSTPSPLDEGLTPERLTEVLRAGGALDGGRVVEVAVETSRKTLISVIDRLRLRYDGGDGPATLIRKELRQDIAPDLASILGRDDALLENYRLSAAWQITTPVWQASFRLNAAVWWSHLERGMLAFDDLNCRELLG